MTEKVYVTYNQVRHWATGRTVEAKLGYIPHVPGISQQLLVSTQPLAMNQEENKYQAALLFLLFISWIG